MLRRIFVKYYVETKHCKMGAKSMEISSVMFIHYLRSSRMSTRTFHIWVKFGIEHLHLMPLSFSELRETPCSDSRISIKYLNEFLCVLWKCIARYEWNSL